VFARAQQDDPLAELARLIGQSDPVDDFGYDGRNGGAHGNGHAGDDGRGGSFDWGTDNHDAEADAFHSAGADPYSAPGHFNGGGETGHNDGYEGGYAAHPEQPYDQHDDQNQHQEPRREPRYAAGFAADADRYRAPPSPPRQNGYAPRLPDAFSAPPPRFNGGDDHQGYPAPVPSRLRDQEPAQDPPYGRQANRPAPSFLPRSRDDRYTYGSESSDPSYDDGDDRYMDDAYDEDESGGRRRGFVFIAAVLGLAVLGTAGAFAYRAMFGGSMLPSLPPIIKADDGPNKIVPSASAQQANTADPGAGGEKVVSREEQPVDVPAQANAAPRVVATIPIFPDPAAGANGGPVAAPALASPAAQQPIAVPPPSGPTAAMPATALTTPKKIHTVPVHQSQFAAPDSGASSAAAVPLTAPAARPVAAAKPLGTPMPAAASGGNAPLSIVPSQGDTGTAATAPARVRTALARPVGAGDSTPVAGGGYSVQVTSQRSEADAQSAFRTLKAQYPAQLGGREPVVRRADLGDKGVYYRALVGPFASMEQAAGLCSSLKAAGGNCIVQRN
jgi:hypothetical protein